MTDPCPTDSWKLARLVLLLGVMAGMLMLGIFARIAWGVPKRPFGSIIGPPSWRVAAPHYGVRLPRPPNPFAVLQEQRAYWEYWNGKPPTKPPPAGYEAFPELPEASQAMPH